MGLNPARLCLYKKRQLGHRHRGEAVWGHREKTAICKPRRGLRGTRACQHPVLGPPASRTRRKETSAKLPNLWGSLRQTHTDPYLTPHVSR